MIIVHSQKTGKTAFTFCQTSQSFLNFLSGMLTRYPPPSNSTSYCQGYTENVRLTGPHRKSPLTEGSIVFPELLALITVPAVPLTIVLGGHRACSSSSRRTILDCGGNYFWIRKTIPSPLSSYYTLATDAITTAMMLVVVVAVVEGKKDDRGFEGNVASAEFTPKATFPSRE